MKWFGRIVFSLITLWTATSMAAEPRQIATRFYPAPISPTGYADGDAKEAPPPVIAPHAPVHYRQASWDIWSGTYNGYVYSPGACDYTPPCVNHLWDGYVQRPLRCYPPHMHAHHGCRGGCGGGACGACNSCGSVSSCGCGNGCRTKRAHAWHFGGKMWSCASCGDVAPSCGLDGAKDYSPDVAPTPADGPPKPMPETGGDLPKPENPAPAPEKAARGLRLRGFTWPDHSIQR